MSGRYWSACLLILLLQLITILYGKVPANKSHRWTPDFKVNKLDCWFNPLVVRNGSCNVKFVDRDTQLLSGTFYIVDKQYVGRVHATVFYKFRVYRKFLVEFDIDMCNLQQHPLFALALPIFLKNSNLPSNYDFKCPFHGNYTITNLKLDSRFLPNTIVPSGSYRIDLRVYHPQLNATGYDGKLYFEVPESRDAHIDRSMG